MTSQEIRKEFFKAALLAAAKDHSITGFGNAANNADYKSAYWQATVEPFRAEAAMLTVEEAFQVYNESL